MAIRRNDEQNASPRRPTGSGLLGPVTGFARAFGRTAAGMTLDLASGAARLGEATVDTLVGRHRAPGVLRVQVLILRDESGTPLCSADAVRPSLENAGRILQQHAGLRVRVVGVRTVSEIPPPEALDPRANRGLMIDDMLGHTAFYRRHLGAEVNDGVDPGLVAAPITVVVVRNIAGNTTGCSLGISADWVITQSTLYDAANPHSYDETVLAHELGHALNLPHHSDHANLMFPVSSPPQNVRGMALTRWQRAVLQTNRHVVPGRSGDPVDLG
ncbi:hypothetical protein ABIB25_003130 [Nakamurella sp. UYEF19]|uniref:matrixin family metalloprotease n=1 Tax=Nakamurella sp. UYEF19 TaxID=1756392 RepID=UPI00339109BC